MLGKDKYFIDDNLWQDVTVPHDYYIAQDTDSTCAPSLGYKPASIGWYYTVFDVPESQEGAVLLDFEGVAIECAVYVNGTLACEVIHDRMYRIVNVTVTDEHGVLCSDAAHPITITVKDGAVIGCSNGNPNDPMPGVCETVKAFHGRCQFIVEGVNPSIHLSTTELAPSHFSNSNPSRRPPWPPYCL